jgi:hypothetical protein
VGGQSWEAHRIHELRETGRGYMVPVVPKVTKYEHMGQLPRKRETAGVGEQEQPPHDFAAREAGFVRELDHGKVAVHIDQMAIALELAEATSTEWEEENFEDVTEAEEGLHLGADKDPQD